MTTLAKTQPKTPRIKWKALAWAAPASMAAAIVINLILYYIGTSTGLIHHDLPMAEGGKQITEIPTIMATIMGMFFGFIVFAVLALVSKNPLKIFTYIAVAALLLSFVTPFVLPGISISMAIWLNLMHITAFILMLWFLNRFVK